MGYKILTILASFIIVIIFIYWILFSRDNREQSIIAISGKKYLTKRLLLLLFISPLNYKIQLNVKVCQKKTLHFYNYNESPTFSKNFARFFEISKKFYNRGKVCTAWKHKGSYLVLNNLPLIFKRKHISNYSAPLAYGDFEFVVK